MRLLPKQCQLLDAEQQRIRRRRSPNRRLQGLRRELGGIGKALEQRRQHGQGCPAFAHPLRQQPGELPVVKLSIGTQKCPPIGVQKGPCLTRVVPALVCAAQP